MSGSNEPNGNGEHARTTASIVILKADHEEMRATLETIQAEQQRQAESLRFIEHQVRLTGQAMELLLQSKGLDMPDGEDDA